jgi:tetratricopeptide (TPR) repeat protein/predicted aspartyl protease
MPVTMVGTRPTITVKINGKDGRFLVDSGAFYSSIDTSAMTKFGLKAQFVPNLLVQGIGGLAQPEGVTVKEFILANVPFRSVEFMVLPDGDSSIDGILGQNFLSRADVEYDLANGLIRFLKPSQCGKANLAYWSKPGEYGELDMLPSDSDLNKHIQAIAVVNGKKIRVTFDTGAWRSILSLKAAARAGVTPQTSGAVSSGAETGVGSRHVETWIAPFDSFALDSEQIQHTRLRIGGADLAGSDMLLGADFFLSHRVYVANQSRKIFFTYIGGPVFILDGASNLKAPDRKLPESAASDAPSDAAGFARRAAAFAARLDYAHAIEDFDRAIALEPSNPKTFADRGEVRMRSRQTVLAMSDFDQALTLKPDDVSALVLRANLYGDGGDTARARIDLKTAAGLTVGDAVGSFRVAEAYARFRFYPDAIAAYDQAFAAKPGADLTPALLNGRCWARAVARTDLDKALSDCNAAVKQEPHNANILDSRAFLHLARGEWDAAVVDYDTALAVQPKFAFALYGRGIAKLRKGAKDQGDADIQAATALNPKIADRAKGIGLTP